MTGGERRAEPRRESIRRRRRSFSGWSGTSDTRVCRRSKNGAGDALHNQDVARPRVGLHHHQGGHHHPQGTLRIDGTAEVAYVVPYVSDGTGVFAIRLLAEGYRVGASMRTLTAAGNNYPAGTFVIRISV